MGDITHVVVIKTVILITPRLIVPQCRLVGPNLDPRILVAECVVALDKMIVVVWEHGRATSQEYSAHAASTRIRELLGHGIGIARYRIPEDVAVCNATLQ
jgi:hypothetical protein